jgi:hypothetical protein
MFHRCGGLDPRFPVQSIVVRAVGRWASGKLAGQVFELKGGPAEVPVERVVPFSGRALSTRLWALFLHMRIPVAVPGDYAGMVQF